MMELTVSRRADTVATFRHTFVTMMETLAGWVPSTAEMEIKILFGRHLWDVAQHADAFGNRTAELRLGPHVSRDPLEVFQELLDRVRSCDGTADRIAGFYDVLLPQVSERIARYLASTDRMMDEPTVRILERIESDFVRMREERDSVVASAPFDLAVASDRIDQLRGAVTGDTGWVDFRPAPAEG